MTKAARQISEIGDNTHGSTESDLKAAWANLTDVTTNVSMDAQGLTTISQTTSARGDDGWDDLLPTHDIDMDDGDDDPPEPNVPNKKRFATIANAIITNYTVKPCNTE